MNKQQTNTYLSPNQKAIRRLLRNKPAIFGLIVIGAALFIAIFAYLIVPDATPSANDQVLEIATSPPNFSIQMLQKRKNRKMPEQSWWNSLLYGTENPYISIPITEYNLDGENMIIQRYTGSTLATEKETLPLVDLVFPLAADPNIKQEDNKISFNNVLGERQTTNVDDLQKQVQQQLITKSYLLGTDKFGRDNLSRLVLGVRISLSVGLMAVLISLLIGVTLGAISGYFGGWVDDVVMWVINVFWSIPLLLLVFAMVLALGRDFWQIYLAVGLTMWVELARIVRGQVLSLREKEYVEAAYSLGFSHFRIITTHILPNLVGPIVVITAANFATAIIIEAGLSFLGIGVQPPTPSWGTMLNEYYGYMGTDKAYLALIPGVAILLLVLAFNLVGNGLRDALDVKTN